ncbi:MAG: hypothetical protein ACYS7M_14600 [Planctomycetota bacterium]|jgi:hypothetical protein
MTTGMTPHETEFNTKGFGTRIPFDSLNECGTYVCNWSGHLLRVAHHSCA